MKYFKLLIFLIFVGFSVFIIYNHYDNNLPENINLDFIVRDANVLDMANILTIKSRVILKENIDLIHKVSNVKILLITLNDSSLLSNIEYSKLILDEWIKKNELDGQNAVVIGIYKKNPEINFVFTDDLDYILTKDFSVGIVRKMKGIMENANNYMKISLKEGRVNDDRYKNIIGEGVYEVLEDMRKELQKAIFTIRKGEYELNRKNSDLDDKRVTKRIFDNTIILSLIFSIVFLLIGGFLYYLYKNRCPQCGNRLRKDVGIVSYPKGNVPGIKEFSYGCVVCGFTHKEREVFFDKKINKW